MAATGTAMAPAPAPSAANPALVEQKMKLQQRIRGGSGWFMAIAAFSVINSALVFFNAKLHFIVGLGITQIADGIGTMGGAAGSIAGLVVSLFAAGVFTLFWKFSREGNQWAFIVGMIQHLDQCKDVLGPACFLPNTTKGHPYSQLILCSQ